jgi:hypothetical protein
MLSSFMHRGNLPLRTIRSLCTAIVLSITFYLISLQDARAQSALDIRGSLSLKISKGRLSLKVGEIANNSGPGVVSSQLELSLWLSKNPYDGSLPLEGLRLAKCRLDGIVGSETVANISCGAKLRWISRGKYYAIITLSELDSSTGTFVERDFFTFSKRIKL